MPWTIHEKCMTRAKKSEIPIGEIPKRLDKEYPNATTALRFSTPLELLIATILFGAVYRRASQSGQRNIVSKYRTASDYARASKRSWNRTSKHGVSPE